MTDISGFISSFLNEIVNFFKVYFETLDKISFSGISLLDFTVTLFVLGVAIPLIITLLPSRAVSSVRDYDRKVQSENLHARRVREAEARAAARKKGN